jgi:alkylation response protein AidB-like acyl-CoA dehydrogenase
MVERGLPKVYDRGRLLGAALKAMGTEEQKKKFLPMIGRGEIIVWQAFTEPEAGSDAAAMKSTALPTPEGFILNGQKTYIGDSHPPDYLYILAVTDPQAARHANLSAFMVKADLPGISYTALQPIAGAQKNSIYFEDVFITRDDMIGEMNHGWQVMNASLQAERGGWGEWFRINELYWQLVDYCKKTKRNGKILMEHPRVKMALGDLYFTVRSLDLIRRYRKWRVANDLPTSYEGSMESLYIKTVNPHISDVLLETVGPLALVTDPDWSILIGRFEHFQRASILTHGAGTPEVLKLTIGRAIGLPGMRRSK